MDCLTLDSSYDHLSSFLEEFQDKNSHLFPSADMCALDNTASLLSCGTKRARETSYDVFNSWNEELLSDSLEPSATITESIASVKQSYIDSARECPPLKKRKLSKADEVSLMDARSRSPPFQTLDIECTPNERVTLPPAAIPAPVTPSTTSNVTPKPMNPRLHAVLGSIGKLNGNVRDSIMSSLKRLASKVEKGKNPLSIPPSPSPRTQYDSSIDYLTMQTLFGAPPTSSPTLPVVKSERASYFPPTATSGGIPFVLNTPYVMPAVPLNCVIPKSLDTTAPSYATYSNVYVANPCTKPLLYSDAPSSSMNSHFVPTQNLPYSQQQAVVHV